MRQTLDPLVDVIDVAVLGCTHFPLIREEISQVLGKGVELIDSGTAIARRVVSLLTECGDKEGLGSKEVFSSASPKQEEALNKALDDLGFSPVQLMQIQDA